MTDHQAVMSIAAIIVVLIVITSIAGHDAEAGTAMVALMAGILLVWGMSHTGVLSSISKYPMGG